MVDDRACYFFAVANVSDYIGRKATIATDNDKHQGLVVYQKQCL